MAITNRLAWVDVETSGLYPEKGARVVEIGLIITNDTAREYKELERFHTLIRLEPEFKKIASAAALKINGYGDDEGQEWATAPYPNAAIWKEVVRLTQDCTMVAQNWPFDQKFIESELARFNLKPKWTRRFIDVMSFSWMVTRRFGIDSFSLENAYNALGKGDIQPHRSMTDIQRCIEVVKHIDEYYPIRAVAA